MTEIFLKIMNMSIAASWLILAVLAFRVVFTKMPKWVNVLLWGIVAVRLICPFSIESSVSLMPDSIGNGELVSEWADDYIGDVDIHHTGSVYYDAAVGAGREPIYDGVGGYYVVTKHDQLGEPSTVKSTVIPVLAVLWVSGMSLLVLYTMISYWRLRRKVSEAVILQENIFQSENVGSPFVLGIIKPKIYLPYNMDAQDLEHVVAHERAHIRRKDHLWKPLGFFLLAIHWFNPLMWLAYVLLCRDIELACDEKVIQDLGNEQRADYSQALMACSVNRRVIAACPLAFGEVGVKERVQSVLNYRKPAFWVIVVSVIACVVAAICFLTNPVSFYFDRASNIIVSANHFDMRSADEAVAVEMNLAQIGELSSRLAGIKNAKKNDKYGGFTPGYQISALLKDGTYIRISGYSFSDNGRVDIEWNGERYVVSDGEFQDYLSRICAGADISSSENASTNPVSSVTKWFDYLEKPAEMKWNGSLEIDLPEFPDVTFRWSYATMEAVVGDETTSLYTGMPIWNAYFCDLTGDGLPELCSTLSIGSGMIDNRVIIYDYANGASYSLEDRGVFDYTLRQGDADGQLYVDKSSHVGGGIVASGRLVFQDDCLQILGENVPTDAILKIIDPTDDPDFNYATAVEKIYEDEKNEYFLSGLYSQHVVVHYTDGTQEDIVAALNSGRATIADLDKFGIRYWAEPKAASSVIAKNTVAEIGRGTLKTAVELNNEDAASLLSLAESGSWVQATKMPDFDCDCALNLGGRLIYYCSKEGALIEFDLSEMTTISHKDPLGGRYWMMTIADQIFVNNILCRYIELMYGITDVPAPDPDLSAEYSDTLDAAISAATLKHYASDKPDGLFHVESHVILHQETEQTGKIVVYAMSLLDKYGFAGAAFEEVESWYEPIKLTFEYTDQRGYRLSDAWFPTRPAGSWDALSDEIYRQFSMCSEDLANDALFELLDENYLVRLKQDCYAQAVRYGGVGTAYVVERLLEKIEASFVTPVTQYNTACHLGEYKELTYYGRYTLRYIFSRFLEGGQTELRGHIMRELLDDLAPEAQLRLYAATGQEYFDEWKAAALRVGQQHDMDWIEKNQPAIRLLLQMIEE